MDRLIADPTCDRCGAKKVWIGIGPGAEARCPKACAPVLPHTRCPQCKSFRIAPFDASFVTYWFGSPVPADADAMHCIDCGKLFTKGTAL